MIPPRPAGKPSAESAQKETLLRAEYVLPNSEQAWSPRAPQVRGAGETAPSGPGTDTVSRAETQALLAKGQFVSRLETMTRLGEKDVARAVRRWGGFVLGLTAGAAIGMALAHTSHAPRRRAAVSWPWLSLMAGLEGAVGQPILASRRSANGLGNGVSRSGGVAGRSHGVWGMGLLAAFAAGVIDAKRSATPRPSR